MLLGSGIYVSKEPCFNVDGNAIPWIMHVGFCGKRTNLVSFMESSSAMLMICCLVGGKTEFA
jgi:hypothetical protein